MTRHAAIAVAPHDLRAVAHGTSHAPHSVLGPHVGESSVTIRTLRPLADAVVVVTADQEVAATHEQDGICTNSLGVRDGTEQSLQPTRAHSLVRMRKRMRGTPEN